MAGIATFPVLMLGDILLPADRKPRTIAMQALADIPLYLHLPLMVGLWALFIARLGEWSSGAPGAMSGWQVAGMALRSGGSGRCPTCPSPTS